MCRHRKCAKCGFILWLNIIDAGVCLFGISGLCPIYFVSDVLLSLPVLYLVLLGP